MNNVVSFPTDSGPDWLKKYYELGFRLIFYPTKQKGPSGPEAVGWTTRSDKFENYADGQNVGTFTGHEISPGKFLADIDFDWSEGVSMARRILPPTGFGFGRASRKLSHAFYTTPEPIQSLVFKNIDEKNIVELRGIKQDGTIALQTMLPPSIHPSGETVVLRLDGDPGHAEDLPRRVALYATACILFDNFSNKEFVHDVRLSVAGFLLTEGLTKEEVLAVGTAICEATGNNSKDFETLTNSTAQKMKSGDRIVGAGTLIKALGDKGKLIVSRIKEWLGCADFISDAKGKPLGNSQENVRRALEKLNVSLSYDVFSQKPMVEVPDEGGRGYSGPLNDSFVNSIWLEIDEKFYFRPDRTFFNSVIDNEANRNKFHPVLDYLKSLTWDGVPRIAEWLIQSGGAADTPYVRAVSTIMLLAAVRRVTQPGCKYDEMVVLESAQQGLMKSTALRSLCPNEKWFSDDLPLNVDAKQIVERTLGKWIIEASDLSGMRASAVEHLKGMLSRQVDGPVRLAYGRIPVEQPRQSIIVGTTNSYSYLTDTTGNRRFWPVRIHGFNIAWILENRDQLWAEAASREAAGESIRLHPDLYEHAAYQQERRRAEDPWEIKLDSIFPRNQKWRLAPDEIWGALGIPIDRQDPRAHARVLKAMEALGFRRISVRREDFVVKGFGRDVETGQPKLDGTDHE